MMIREFESKTISSVACVRALHVTAGLAEPSFEPDLCRLLMVEPGTKVALRDIDPSYGGHWPHERSLALTQSHMQKIDNLQYLMHAEKKRSLLIVLQGIDAGGKDGVVRHILTNINPAECRVAVFKQPTSAELAHDFLWRVHPHAPAKGEMAIFNRSHYEDVLVARVHAIAPVNEWPKRYGMINDFERLLVEGNGTTILKFFLHISKEEQLARFKMRLDDPSRRWKISEADYTEREYWDQYTDAFEDMLCKTSTYHAPWFVIPANNKWFRNLAVSQIIARTLEDLDMKLPEPSVNIAHIRRQHHAAEAEAKAS